MFKEITTRHSYSILPKADVRRIMWCGCFFAPEMLITQTNACDISRVNFFEPKNFIQVVLSFFVWSFEEIFELGVFFLHANFDFQMSRNVEKTLLHLFAFARSS